MNFIITPLRAVIDFIYMGVGDYAVAIILFTLVVKLILLPLDLKQRSSTKKMAALNPKLAEINKKYEKDPEKKSAKTMELYRKEKINPMSGCLPMLIQFPVLIAMFSVMRHVADERVVSMFLDVYNGGAEAFTPESFLWVQNLWQPDNIMAMVIPDAAMAMAIKPISGNAIVNEANLALLQANYETVMAPVMDIYNAGKANGWAILPIVAGVSQLFSAKMLSKNQPAAQPSKSGSPDMSKMMTYMMPIMSVFFCWQYNAAFAIYWVTSNLYSILLHYGYEFYYKQKEKKASSLEAEGTK